MVRKSVSNFIMIQIYFYLFIICQGDYLAGAL